MNNTSSLQYKSCLYNGKNCIKCGVNGSIRKFSIVFKYSHRARCCAKCIDDLGGVENTAKWLEKNAVFVNQNEFYLCNTNMRNFVPENPLLKEKKNSLKTMKTSAIVAGEPATTPKKGDVDEN